MDDNEGACVAESSSMLHFRCYDRKGRQGDTASATYDIYVSTAHIIAVRPGFMDATRVREEYDSVPWTSSTAMVPIDKEFLPDPSRTTITMDNGEKFMVEGAFVVNASRVMRAKEKLHAARA